LRKRSQRVIKREPLIQQVTEAAEKISEQASTLGSCYREADRAGVHR